MRRPPGVLHAVLALTLLAGGNTGSLCAQADGGDSTAMQLLRSGRDAMQRGDLAQAERLFQRAVATAPSLADASLGLGLVQLRRGESDAAAKSLAHAAALNPQLQGPHLFLGIAQYQAGQNEAAMASLRAELALNPDNLEALTWSGIVGLGSGRPDQAIAPLDHAVALKPNDPQLLYYQAKAHEGIAKTALGRLYQLDPDSALVHRAMAEDLAESGQPEKAIDEYQTALRKQPGDADMLDALAEQQQKLSRFDDAAKTYQQELTLNPNSPLARYNLGKIDVEHGKPAEGVTLLREAVAAHARPAPTDFYLGLGLAELGQNEEAAHWLEQSLASQPSAFIEQSAFFQLARVYQHLNRKADAERAIEQLKRLKAQASPNASSKPGAAVDLGSPSQGQP